MAMGHKQDLQSPLLIPHAQLPQSAGHPFYLALDRALTQSGFDSFVESVCRPAYAAPRGRPSLPPGVYFRCRFVGYFESLRSQLGIAWRISDSLSLRSFLAVERRDTGQSYQDFMCDLAKAQGIENPTKEQCACLDRKRKNKASNKAWVNPDDPEARVAKMKDGRTHLAYKNEHAIDLDTGALLLLHQ